jgi:predicted 2-oxoglutarate/Fe(II)-dependent dioxygenase YbiX
MTLLPPRTPAHGYAIWHAALSRDACARTVAAIDMAEARPGRVLRHGVQQHDAAMRACTEHVLAPDDARPVAQAFLGVARLAHGGGPALLDGPRFCRYRQGGHFRAHRDRSHDSADMHAVRTRRISLVCLLNDDAPAFDGGALVLYLPDEHGRFRPVNAPLRAGSVIAFASDLLHEVRPVRQGTRYSAVAWLYDVPNQESNDAEPV